VGALNPDIVLLGAELPDMCRAARPGGIGSFAVQLAKHLGARVATTVSARDIDYAKALGADTVVDYKSQKFEEVLRDLDAILDTVGGDTYTRPEIGGAGRP
jgi:NADPH:quinone reductase-like Zn-dependent oxidoreductase